MKTYKKKFIPTVTCWVTLIKSLFTNRSLLITAKVFEDGIYVFYKWKVEKVANGQPETIGLNRDELVEFMINEVKNND